MEFCIDPAVPTYAGSLGILAGDTIRTAADLGLSAVGVTLLHRKGYFHQLYDRFILQWRRDNLYLKYAIRIPLDEIWKAYTEAK